MWRKPSAARHIKRPFCSKACIDAHREAARVPVRCETCGVEFTRLACTPSKVFCSRPCKDKGMAERFRGAGGPSWNGGRRIRDGGYVSIYWPGHPRAMNDAVDEHVLVAERALGHPLPPRAVVHHVNRNPGDNRPSNLVICEDQGYHLFLHYRMRIVEGGGRIGESKPCRDCHVVKPLSEFGRIAASPDGLNGACRDCHNTYYREMHRRLASERVA